MGQRNVEAVADEWVTFPGGELEGKRPKALCPACRETLRKAALGDRSQEPGARSEKKPGALCFQCYRADLERDRALQRAGDLDTGSAERFQYQLPLEPVNRPRLQALKAAVAESRAATSPHTDKRRRAQIEARRALANIAAGLRARGFGAPGNAAGERVMFEVVRAAELQLPDAWLPFVVSR